MTAKREKSERIKYTDKQHKLRMSVRELLNEGTESVSFGVDSLEALQAGGKKQQKILLIYLVTGRNKMSEYYTINERNKKSS